MEEEETPRMMVEGAKPEMVLVNAAEGVAAAAMAAKMRKKRMVFAKESIIIECRLFQCL